MVSNDQYLFDWQLLLPWLVMCFPSLSSYLLLNFPSIWFSLSITREAPMRADGPMGIRTHWTRCDLPVSSCIFLCQLAFPWQRNNHQPNSQLRCVELSRGAESYAWHEHCFVYLSLTSTPRGRIIVIKTQESEWVSKSTQLVSDRAGIQTQGRLPASVMFLIYILARE